MAPRASRRYRIIRDNDLKLRGALGPILVCVLHRGGNRVDSGHEVAGVQFHVRAAAKNLARRCRTRRRPADACACRRPPHGRGGGRLSPVPPARAGSSNWRSPGRQTAFPRASSPPTTAARQREIHHRSRKLSPAGNLLLHTAPSRRGRCNLFQGFGFVQVGAEVFPLRGGGPFDGMCEEVAWKTNKT